MLRTWTFIRSPRSARSVGPRWPPLNPQVGVATPGRNSVLPVGIRRSKTRVPSLSTVEGASGGTATVMSTRFSRRRPLVFSMPTSIPGRPPTADRRPPTGHEAEP